MQKITPFLWFDGKAEKAVNCYLSIFKNQRLGELLDMAKQDQDRRGR
jgi:predicted 3-demethylubiquinone-9 3-methyltransferase (glyoxalase superfamily)